MTQVDHAIVADIDPVDPLGAEESPIGAAEILQDPGVPVDPQDPVPPRNPRVGHDDVRLRIPADTVRGPALELVNRTPGTHDEIGCREGAACGPADLGWRGLGEPGRREPGLGGTGLRRLPVRPVETLGWHVYKV